MKNQDTTKPENSNKEPIKQERQKQEFQRRNPNPASGGPVQRSPRDTSQNMERETPQGQSRDNHKTGAFKEIILPRQNYSYQNSQTRFNTRVKTIETVEDIKADIVRIEKEIDLEIKEIKTMRLGL